MFYNTFEACSIFQEIGIDWNHQVNVKYHHGPLGHASCDLLDGNDDHVGKVVFVHESCPPSGMCFHLLHDNMYTEYHLRTETDIYLKNDVLNGF